MEDGRKTNGGHKTNGGRKPKADEEKVNSLFVRALKEMYNKKTDDEAKVQFVKELLDSQRGQLFVAEHIFGKAPQEIKQTNLNLDKEDLTDEVIQRIRNNLNETY